MNELYTCTDRIYVDDPKGGPRIFIAGKGDQIPMAQAVALGLAKAEKPAVKARKIEDVENKAVKPSAAGTKSAKK